MKAKQGYLINDRDIVPAKFPFAILQHGANLGEHLEGLLANLVANNLVLWHDGWMDGKG